MGLRIETNLDEAYAWFGPSRPSAEGFHLNLNIHLYKIDPFNFDYFC